MRWDRIPDELPVLREEGPTLRALGEEDLPAWLARLSDPEAAALAGDPVATSMDVVVEGLAQHRSAFAEKEAVRWAIVPDLAGGSVGSIGLFAFDAERGSAEIGAAIGRPYWNRSLGTRAGRLVVGFGFSVLGLQRIEAVVLEVNRPVRRVLEKLGFHRSGREVAPDWRAYARQRSHAV